ncbi:MAG: histidine--tRNA ligase [Candidatus Micrarchaeota archaeon]
MAKFTTPKGMRDFSGSEMQMREQMLDGVRRVYKKWGYQPLSNPALENITTLTAKSGEEIAGQLFRVEESELALRFDLTVGLARFAANTSTPKPYKRYCIAPVWRREEPQKGRMREFLQADADIIGSTSMRCEGELLAMACEALQEIGFGEFKIFVNNRKILNGIIEKLQCEENEGAVLRALDKLDKIGIEGVKKELEKSGVDKKSIGKLMDSVMQKYGDNEKMLKIAKEYSSEGAAELEKLLKILKDEYEISNVFIDLSMVRGLGYYTGPIFEIKASEEIGSVAGGGRYDTLLGLYGQNDYAVGISLGIERLFALKKEEIRRFAQSDVMIVCIEEKYYSEAIKIASKLREGGINAETDLNERKMRGQLEYANACNISFALILGKKEIESGKYTLKNLKTGEQKEMDLEKIIEQIKAKKS